MELQYVKAHCTRYNKWFALELDQVDSKLQVVNFVNLREEAANGISTTLTDTSFPVSPALRACCKCGARKAGLCDHIEALGLCGAPYSYQCLFCNQLKISRKKATGRFSEYAGVSNIPNAEKDRFGNPLGSQYDLARDGSYAGFHIAILCLFTGENILTGIKQPIRALEKKGFRVTLRTGATPNELRKLLKDACQLWIISDKVSHLSDEHYAMVREFYQNGGGLYLFGDNEPYYVDANVIARSLFDTGMSGNYRGDQVIGVQTSQGSPGIIRGHLISTGIVNLYEGVTIATVKTKANVKPLVIASSGEVVTGIVEEDGRRALIDGGFTRLFFKWDTAGTDRLIVNTAAWLANADGMGGAEVSFT